MLSKIKHNKLEFIILLLVLIVSGVAHGYNMFHFPYYENDEGTYMSQAWSLLTKGKLAPYTYWYDHAPAGWILIALWTKLIGGFFTFGTSVNSGRVLMLLLHLGTTALLFYIAKKLSKSYFAGIIATLIFSLSPLGIYFQRRVLLDNIMIFWVFVSLAVLLKDQLKLSHIIISAITFGIAVLTKENAIFFVPAFMFIVYSRSHIYHKSFAFVKWLAIVGIVVSFYFLYALLKKEFFPPGFLGDNTPHVSLISTLQEQLARGSNYPFWDKRSDFYTSLMEWIARDSLTIILGAVTTVLSIILSIKEKSLRIPVFFVTLFWLFLMRGKLVIDFYITPLIPLIALNTGILLVFFTRCLSFNKKFVYYLLNIGIIVAIPACLLSVHSMEQYVKDETTSQIKAIEWIKANLPEASTIIIDNSIYVDLHDKRFEGDKVFVNADWAWKAVKDPEIYEKKLQKDWRNVEYITLTHEILKQIRQTNFDFIRKALDNSYLIVDWKENSSSYIDIANYISTNGDWMAIYKVKDINEIKLENSWKFYKANFIKSYGQVVDPNTLNTTSEGQSYAMLRAVWLGDKETFDGVWAWTRDHLQYRLQDRLFSWLWIGNGNGKVADSATASDADQDIALALLFAYGRWGEEAYLNSAKEIIEDIWEREVVRIGRRYYLIAGSGADRNDGYLVNPSYLSPATYRIFAEVDTKHPWIKLAEDSYHLLNELGTQTNNSTYLPPNWIFIDKQTGKINSAVRFTNDKESDFYGFDAFRIMWRVSLDARWFNSQEAIAYLQKVSRFFEKEWRENKKYVAIYSISGEAKSNFVSLSNSVGAFSVLMLTNNALAEDMYSDLFDREFNHEDGFWGDRNNYYDQNWAWFGTALYIDRLPNLWKMD